MEVFWSRCFLQIHVHYNCWLRTQQEIIAYWRLLRLFFTNLLGLFYRFVLRDIFSWFKERMSGSGGRKGDCPFPVEFLGLPLEKTVGFLFWQAVKRESLQATRNLQRRQRSHWEKRGARSWVLAQKVSFLRTRRELLSFLLLREWIYYPKALRPRTFPADRVGIINKKPFCFPLHFANSFWVSSTWKLKMPIYILKKM